MLDLDAILWATHHPSVIEDSGIEFCVLGSGSGGNSVFVRGGGTSLLIDCGFSGKETKARLEACGLPGAAPDAILITHEHLDHLQHAGVVARAFDVPIYVNDATRARWPERLLKGTEPFEQLISGQTFRIGNLEIETWEKRHDAAEPVSVLVTSGDQTFGCLTDLGTVTPEDLEMIARSDLLFLEANHDPGMLARGPYPPSLRRRVGGAEGHLSNEAAARALAQAGSERLETVVLGHLSMKNNDLLRVRDTFVQHSGQGPGYQRWISKQDRPTKRFKVARGGEGTEAEARAAGAS